MSNKKIDGIKVSIPCKIKIKRGNLVLLPMHNLGPTEFHGPEGYLFACSYDRAVQIIAPQEQQATPIPLGTNNEHTATKAEMVAIIDCYVPKNNIKDAETFFGATRGFVSIEDVKKYACDIYYTLSADDINKTPLGTRYQHIADSIDFDRACNNIKNILEEHNARWDKFQDACKSKEAIHSLYDAFSPEGFCNTQTHDIPSRHLQLIMRQIRDTGFEQAICLQRFKQVYREAYREALGTTSPEMSDSEIATLSCNAMKKAIQDFENNMSNNEETQELIAALYANNERFAAQAIDDIEAWIGGVIKSTIEDDKANTKPPAYLLPNIKDAIARHNTAGNNPQTAGDYSNIGEPETSDNFDVGDGR